MIAVLFMLLGFLAPQSQSAAVGSIQVNPLDRYAQSQGDTWITAWADDGNIYSVSDDTSGFELKGPSRNLMVHRLSGDNPRHLQAVTVNRMDEYGKETEPMSALGYGPSAARDGRAWKADGITAIDGALYVFVSKHDYPWRNRNLKDNRQTAADSSIIKSTDHGLSWTRTAKENYFDPMFPGRRFGAPFFITYRKDGKSNADGSNKFVYAVSNNGYWNNGDELYLGRVRRDLLPRLKGTDWEFYRDGNGLSNAAWTRDLAQARPILVDPGQVSMSAVQYVEPLGLYLLCQWHYAPNTFGGKSIWSFRIAKAPWGPWRALPEDAFDEGFYNPAIVNKFSSADGHHLVASTAGDFKRPKIFYKLYIEKIRLVPQ
ncbi:MAG TPA: hypothetical protein VGI45_27260 [Terracidiphilus sp.]|jgi:hypothetical protein